VSPGGGRGRRSSPPPAPADAKPRRVAAPAPHHAAFQPRLPPRTRPPSTTAPSDPVPAATSIPTLVAPPRSRSSR
jgi:hypothetical protein